MACIYLLYPSLARFFEALCCFLLFIIYFLSMIEASGIFGTRCHFIRLRFASGSLFFGKIRSKSKEKTQFCRVFFAGETNSKNLLHETPKKRKTTKHQSVFPFHASYTLRCRTSINPIVTPIKLLNYTYVGLTILDLFLFLLLPFSFAAYPLPLSTCLALCTFHSFQLATKQLKEKYVVSLWYEWITNWILLQKKKERSEYNTA